MAIDSVTGALLGSVLASSTARNLFTTIVNRRIAEAASLKAANPEADQQLDALEKADLISSAPSGRKYYVTAKGLKVARDLEKLPIC
jgi:predicted transcriptional regulator